MSKRHKSHIDTNGKQRTRTPKTIRNIHGLLSAVLAEHHPGLALHTTLPQKKVKEQNVLEPDQIATLLAAVDGDAMELPVLMGVWLCMRASEIMAFTWDCIDFEQKTLTIKKARVRDKDNNWVDKTTKTTGSTRTINVPDYIMDKLAVAKTSSSGDRVVPFTNQSLYGRLKTILKRNGLPNIRFHDLRHTAASVMLALNVPDNYAQARGGWATNHTMKAVYQHMFASKRNTVDSAIDSYYNSLLSPKKTKAGDEPPHIV